MWMTMLYLGLRPGEAAALSWDDIDFDHHIVHVRKGRKRNRGTITIGTTKTTGSVRSLNAPATVIDALATPTSRSADRRGARREPVEQPRRPRLHQRRRLPHRPTQSPRRIQPRSSPPPNLGEGWTPNMLRHSAASLMSDAGIPLERIADQLGHKDTRMLAAHYRHQIRPTIDAALILDDILNRPDDFARGRSGRGENSLTEFGE